MELSSVGIDLGKTIFHLVGLNHAGGGGGAEEILAHSASPFHCEHTSGSDWDGSLPRLSFPQQGSA
jgi:hypothetical protein